MSDHEGLSIFDSGTAAGTFTVVLRGYDRNEVNSYLGRFEAARREADTELERLRSQVDDLSERASTAEQRLQEVGQPTYAGLGGRVSELLAAGRDAGGADPLRCRRVRAEGRRRRRRECR